MHTLPWPAEHATAVEGIATWSHAGSNLCLDFHGDPCRAAVRVFSDGNHHMALHETLKIFAQMHNINDLFYLTLPPPALMPILRSGRVDIGNLRLSLTPDIFISPPAVLERVRAMGMITAPVPFMRSRGNALLVHKHNPLNIRGVRDLATPNVRLFLPNPQWETAAYEVYTATLLAQSRKLDWQWNFAAPAASATPMPQLVYGERIHHREAPTFIAGDRADVALVYYHLALRYTRIFPELFALVELPCEAENIVSHVHVGVTHDAGPPAQALLKFLLSERTAEIYRAHGLLAAGA